MKILKNNISKTILIVFTFCFSNLFATNYYVNPSTGDDLDDGLSSPNAKATLQDVFDTYNLGAGDIIYCEAGTYSETDVRPGSNDEGFTIQGNGQGVTIFDGSSSDGWLYLDNAANDDIKIYDITVQNYRHPWGGGIYSVNSITGTTITDVTFDNCDATSGGGAIVIANVDAQSATITNCTFTNCDATGYDDDFGAYYCQVTGTFNITSSTFHTNHGYDGGVLGIYDGTHTIEKCIFYNNDADDDGAVMYCIGGTYTFENCLFYENSAGSGEVLYSGSSDGTCELRHCTIVDNLCYGIEHSYATTLNIYSCIIQDNTYASNYDIYEASATLNVYNTIYNNKSGTFDTDSNNETTDATFTDKASDDYTIASGSNGIDEGYVAGAPADDLAGNSRDATPDIGCYEAATNTWTGALSTAWLITGNWSLGTIPGVSDTPIIPDVTNQPEITSAVTIAGLTIDSGADITITSNSLTVTGAIDLNGAMYIDNATVNADGTFDATSGAIDFTNASGSLVLSSTVTSLGTLDAAMGSVTYDGGTQTVLADSYYNLSISTAGTKTAGGNIDVNGDLTTAATATCKLDLTTYDLNVAGDLTIGATDGLDLSDASALLTLDGTTDQTVSHAGNSSGSGTTTLLTETFDNAWSSLEKPTASWTSDVASNSGQAWHRNDVTTNWSYTSSGSPSSNGYSGGGTDYYARFHSYGITSPNTTYIQTPSVDMSSYSPGSVTFYYINTSGTDVLEVYFYNGTSWVKQGSSYTTQASWGQKTIAISGAYLNPSFAVRFKATSDYGTTDIGLDQVVISGDYSYSGTESTDLTINKASGSVLLSSTFRVDGTLTFTSGDIDATTNNLVFTANGTTTGASDASHVNGTIVKTTESTSAFTFPIGDGTTYRPIGITPDGASSTDWTVSYTASSHPDTDVDGSGLDHISTQEYWDLDRSGAANASISLTWSAANGITDYTELTIAHYDGTTDWDMIASTPSGSNTSGTINSDAAVTTFSPFTIGSTGTANPLPVELVTFYGVKENEVNNLKWTTASEKNSDYFMIEKTTDGVNFESIGQIIGAGNSVYYNSYTLADQNVDNILNYYRLVQVDFDGVKTYSDIISIDNREGENKDKTLIQITNTWGQEVNDDYIGVVIYIYSDGSIERVFKN